MLEMGMSAAEAAIVASEQAAGAARVSTDATIVQLTVTGCGAADNPPLPPTDEAGCADGVEPSRECADLNSDGRVSTDDLLSLLAQFGREC